MKKFFSFSLLACLLLTACSKEAADEATTMARVNVHVSGFTVSQQDFASVNRAGTALADYSGVKAITLAFYTSDGTTQKYCTTQLKADNSTYTTFGDFSFALPIGNYKMVVLAYGSESPVTFNSMTSVAFGEEKSRETFSFTRDVTVSNAAALDLEAPLNRIVTRLTVSSTDNYVAEAKTIRITMTKGGKGFNPFTGQPTTNTGLVNTIRPASSSVGDVTNITTYFFIDSDEELMNVTIETLDASDNVLFTRTVNDVPFKRNRITQLTGPMYTVDALASGTFTLNTDWLPTYNMDF